MLQIIGTIIFGAIVGILARAVTAGASGVRRGSSPSCWAVAGALIGSLLGLGLTAGRRQRHLGHRLDPVGDQRAGLDRGRLAQLRLVNARHSADPA